MDYQSFLCRNKTKFFQVVLKFVVSGPAFKDQVLCLYKSLIQPFPDLGATFTPYQPAGRKIILEDNSLKRRGSSLKNYTKLELLLQTGPQVTQYFYLTKLVISEIFDIAYDLVIFHYQV
jgi:hypothetical protein